MMLKTDEEKEAIKIIHPIESYTEVNLQKGVSQFAEPLSEMGYKVTLITYENERNNDLSPSAGFTFKKLKSSGLRKITEPLKEIISGNEDIIFSQSLGMRNLIWSFASKFLGKTFLIKLDYMPKEGQHEGLVGKKVRGKIELFLFSLTVDLFTVETPKALKDLSRRYKRLSNKLLFLPSGITLYNGEFLPHRAQEKKKEEEIEEKNKILYVGALRPEKGVETLVKSFNRIKKKYPSWKLEIVGKGPLAFDNIDKKHVDFTGFLKGNELLRKYKEAKIFCLPSRHESFSHVLIEAASMGTAIISTKVGIANYLLKDAGLLFEKGNVKELAEQLEYYINNEEKRREDAGKLKKRALKFDLKKITRRFVSTLKNDL